jgi:phosphate-selective porin
MGREDPTAGTEVISSRVDRSFGSSWRYGPRGLEFNPPGSATSLWMGLRFQYRFDSFEGNLVEPEDLRASVGRDTQMNRSRIKGGGTLLVPWLEVYSEYDFPSSTWLDYRATVVLGERLGLRAGQWKSEFNRERVDSSGKQSLAERSIANYWFTVDRQRGVASSLRFDEGGRADTRLWLEYLSGHGRDAAFEQGDGLLLARVQWNPNGEQLPFSQSDLKRRDAPLGSVAVATVIGETPYTRFSSSGGGSLPGFETGNYRLRQYLLETAVHYRGLAWQQELHLKRIKDQDGGEVRKLIGGYAQLGAFPSEWLSWVPQPLEIVGRFAVVDPDRSRSSDRQLEWTIGANWFIAGHRHKLTADWSWLTFDDPDSDASQGRFRLQWELSL